MTASPGTAPGETTSIKRDPEKVSTRVPLLTRQALIVEDDQRSRFALSVILERGKMRVVGADSGPAALDLLQHRADIGIVLMDIMMPIMNGYQAMEAIRKRREWADLPIIAITGIATDGERERCIAAGASDYAPKPIDTRELLTVLNRWLLATTKPMRPS